MTKLNKVSIEQNISHQSL